MKALIPLCALLLLLPACSDSEPPGDASPGDASPGDASPYEASARDYPAVGTLKTKDYEVTLHSASEGTRYSLRDKTGKLLAKEITKKEVAMRFPKIYEEILTLWAGNEAETAIPIEAPAALPTSPAPPLIERIEVE